MGYFAAMPFFRMNGMYPQVDTQVILFTFFVEFNVHLFFNLLLFDKFDRAT